jgi:hypothetical protein
MKEECHSLDRERQALDQSEHPNAHSRRHLRSIRKRLRQAVHEGFISLSLSDKSIILCFTPLIVYESMQDPFGSLDNSSPLSLQFSTIPLEHTS